MANINDTKTDSWLENMFIGLTTAFTAFSGYIAGETRAGEAEFRGRQAGRQVGQIKRDVSTGVSRIERAGREFTGQQRTAIAKSGVALSGSAEQAITESDRQFSLDAIALRHRGELAIIEKQAEQEFAQIEARGSRALGRLSTARTLLQGVSDIQRPRIV